VVALTLGSLFDGVAGFPLAFSRAGVATKWVVELDAACRTVSGKHFPAAEAFADVRDCGAHNLAPVDIITFGSPCQDVSVAGARAGLDGARSGLFYEALRIVGELKPSWCVWENVPGALSSNDGQDIIAALDALEGLGYVVDLNVLDAQYFGVAQRRRRIFAVCQRADDLRKQRTTTSALTMAQCVVEILGGILTAARSPSFTGYKSSTSARNLSAAGATRRMQLFNLRSAEAWAMLRENLDEWRARSASAPAPSASPTGVSATAIAPDVATLSASMDDAMALACRSWNTSPSWRNFWDGLWCLVKSSTTSTDARTITEPRIYGCATAALCIAACITPQSACSPSYWSAASSALTVIEEFTNYARLASHSLFGAVEWVQPWADYTHRAARLRQSLGDTRDRASAAEILSLSSSGGRDSAPRRAAGEDTPRGAAGGVGGGGEPFTLDWQAGSSGDTSWQGKARSWIVDKPGRSRALTANRTLAVALPGVSELALSAQRVGQLAHREDVDTLIPEAIGFYPTGGTHGVSAGEGTSPAIKVGSGLDIASAPAVAFHLTQDPISGDVAPAMSAGNGQGCATIGVQQAMAVRRLLPVETLRLQGYPDDWLDGLGLSDSTKYRMVGNSIAVPVVAWIAARLVAAENRRCRQGDDD